MARFFINDVGQGRSEEIDASSAGADYGWNCREGTVTNSTGADCAAAAGAQVAPVFEYRRNPSPPGQPAFFEGCASITAGAFVPAGLWPSAYDGAYLFGDYICGKLFVLKPAGGGYLPDLFVANLGGSSIVHMVFGPYEGTQALYYLNYGDGSVRRVRYTGAAPAIIHIPLIRR